MVSVDGKGVDASGDTMAKSLVNKWLVIVGNKGLREFFC
jgi:hypothetical protein